MMKKYYTLALAALLALTGCEKKNEPAEPAPQADAPVFTACIEGSDATSNAAIRKTQIANGSADNKMKVEWLNTDKVFIFSIKNDYAPVVIGEYTVAPNSTDPTKATLNPGSNLIDSRGGTPILTFAYYPASISWLSANRSTVEAELSNQQYLDLAANKAPLMTLPAQQTYYGSDLSEVAPMAARCESGTLSFCNLTALLAIKVPETMFNSVQKITVTADKQLWGDFSLNETSGAGWNQLIPKSTADANKTVTLVCNTSGNNITIPVGGETFYVSIPPATYSSLRITVTDGTTTRSISTQAESITLARNKIYPIDFTQEKTTLLSGKFSVSDTKTVRFTRGNLYWNGSEYRLEANQSDCFTSWSTSHVNHFFWYTPEHVADGYHPYDATNNFGTLSMDDKLFCGVDNPMTVEGTTGLYTLTKEEWNYLIFSRNQTNRFAKARVHGRIGLLLFPDGYTAPLPTTGMAAVNGAGEMGATVDFPTEDIAADTWRVMETTGVAFLPVAGLRTDTEFIRTDDYGSYWTASRYPDTELAPQSCMMIFSNVSIIPQVCSPGMGNPIRLVK